MSEQVKATKTETTMRADSELGDEGTRDLPRGMTAEKLREIADWFDTYDELAESYLGLVDGLNLVDDEERIAFARSTVQGKEVQNELREWAAQIQHATCKRCHGVGMVKTGEPFDPCRDSVDATRA